MDRTLDADRASDARLSTGSTKQEAGANRPCLLAFADTKKCRYGITGHSCFRDGSMTFGSAPHTTPPFSLDHHAPS